MLALLVTRRVAGRLLWRASELRSTTTYDSLDEVCDEIERFAGAGMPPPPGR